MNWMKPALAVTITTVAAFSLASCGSGPSGPDNEAWFKDNCPTQTADVRDVDKGEFVGDPLGKAIVQGPLKPPTNVEEDTEAVGLYTYNETSEQMTEEGQVAAGDRFCLEPAIDEADNSESVDIGNVDSDFHSSGDENTVDFTKLRSPKYPDGIWIDRHTSDLPTAISADEAGNECELNWWTSSDLLDPEADYPSNGEIEKFELADSADC